jgi:hypothetical protein
LDQADRRLELAPSVARIKVETMSKTYVNLTFSMVSDSLFTTEDELRDHRASRVNIPLRPKWHNVHNRVAT